ncbi:hypothetical protein [Nonomuraea sp. NPDC049158]
MRVAVMTAPGEVHIEDSTPDLTEGGIPAVDDEKLLAGAGKPSTP